MSGVNASGLSGPWKAVTVLAAVFALVGVGAAGWYGFSWWTATRDNAGSVIQARDTAVTEAKQLAVTLQTVDPSQPEQAYRQWEAVTTGPMLAKLTQEAPKFLDQLKRSPLRSTASPVDAALTQLDSDAGTATAMVALDVTQSMLVNGTAGPPSVNHLRVTLSLARADDSSRWKVSNSRKVNS